MSTTTTTKPSALAGIPRYELHNGRLQGSPYGGYTAIAAVQPVIEALDRERDELREDLELERQRRAALPRLPTPRLLASGSIAGKRVELRGWHTDDIEIWERQHGLKFGA